MCRLFKKTGIVLLLLTTINAFGQRGSRLFCIDFYEGTINLELDSSLLIEVPANPSEASVLSFYRKIKTSRYQPVIDTLLAYKQKLQLNDWLYYQLIRKTAQQISPKAANYTRYTLYKWFLLAKSGYDARLALTPDKIIFYVYNNEDISDIPFFQVDNKKFMCLNYHDYPKADLNQTPPIPITLTIQEARNPFSYKVTKMPDFKPESYLKKDIEFSYKQKVYHFSVKLNPEVESIFKNYPGVDFEAYFNIPLSKETYSSLIPLLKKNVSGMNQKKGVDYLMKFTRYAFLYEDDEENFGKEKRLSAEETLFSRHSDCDDRAALFFYLVKEIYNLPMIAILYPTHITMAVQFDKPVGKPIIYKGRRYSFCEPTPQKENLQLGQISSKLRNTPYEIVYQYEPQ
ncbi:hypothetical protein BDE36_4298 [Arcticibacter tournemirensis]|uniref:Transglutaminase domain-containing protein n=1 Tax=Arcticibacter tournemirensis TaxID=699437 RepID=A0A5M9GPA1_9SPHI|nr:hypothetical protein [Arcticibacter tournemirensis]KAA8476573.1 hypothetical protein F1649_19815 [Arcticibacter tournemirensis]TQM52479.1 hypothetical protein BDE36_4298 [Arcticibacter tournemirensis]